MTKYMDVHEFNERFTTQDRHGRIRIWCVNQHGTVVEVDTRENGE